MIQGGIATIFVSEMQRSVDFYTGVLGLRLVYRADDHWTISVGPPVKLVEHFAGAEPLFPPVATQSGAAWRGKSGVTAGLHALR